MRNTSFVFLFFLIVARVLQEDYNLSQQRKLIEASTNRLMKWVKEKTVTDIDLNFKLSGPRTFCVNNQASILQLILFPNGRFQYESKGMNGLKKEGFNGVYTINNGNLYFSWGRNYNTGHIIGFDVKLMPKKVLFRRTLFEDDKCIDGE